MNFIFRITGWLCLTSRNKMCVWGEESRIKGHDIETSS